MHGFGQSGTDFVNVGPEKALGFLLAKQGYDVWLGHVRGTTWSRNHKFLHPNRDKEYWNFSVDEIALYDIPAFIDHILKTTNQSSLFYVGYSQGTTGFFMMSSEKPEYNKKVKLMTALAPAMDVTNSPSLVIQSILYFKNFIKVSCYKVFISDNYLDLCLRRYLIFFKYTNYFLKVA